MYHMNAVVFFHVTSSHSMDVSSEGFHPQPPRRSSTVVAKQACGILQILMRTFREFVFFKEKIRIRSQFSGSF